MSVHVLYDAKSALEGLKLQTLELVRSSRQVRSMKDYLHCYDILEVTHEINQPWDHPGWVYGDLAAFVDLEITCKDIILRQDPTREKCKIYILDVTRFLLQWKKMMDNRLVIKFPFNHK